MHKMIETTQLIFQSRFHNNLLTVGIGLVGFDVPPVTVTALQEAVGPVNACLAILAVCEYIKLVPGSVNINKGLLTRLPAAQ